MRGSEWNTLVSEPTATELDAALAEVRVRAVPIARRQARNRKAALVLAVMMVGVTGVAAGRLTSAGLRVSPLEDGLMHDVTRIGANHQIVPAGYQPAPGPLRRWHLTVADAVEGERFNTSEAWVEGPEGTHFSFSINSLGSQLAGRMNISSSADSAVIRVVGSASQTLGTSGVATIKAEADVLHVIQLRRGESVILHPFGTAGMIRTTLRIDGPFAPLPDSGVRWVVPDSLEAMPPWRRSVAAMAQAGIRHGYRGSRSVRVSPFFRERLLPPRVR